MHKIAIASCLFTSCLLYSANAQQTPGGIGSTNLVLWLDPSNTSGATVSSWTDKSPMAKIFTVPASHSAPGRVAGNAKSNYNPYINFTADNQSLSTTGIASASYIDANRNYSLFTVMQKTQTSPNSNYAHYLRFENTNTHNFGIGFNNFLGSYANGQAGGVNQLSLHYIAMPFSTNANVNSPASYANLAASKPLLAYVNSTGSSTSKTYTLGINGNNYTSGAIAAIAANLAIYSTLTIGGQVIAYGMRHLAQEYLMYNIPLTGTNLSKVNSYLALKYG